MNAALTTRNYDGVFSHWQSGRVETLRIVHRVMDGAVTERLESLDGSGRQFVRNGAELTCYLPDQRTVLVEKAPQSLMPAGLPKFDATMADLLPAGKSGHDPADGREGAGDQRHAPRWLPLRLPAVDPALHRHAPEDRDCWTPTAMSSSRSCSPACPCATTSPTTEFKPQLVTTGFQWLRDDGAPAGRRPRRRRSGATTPLPPGFHLAAQTAQMMPRRRRAGDPPGVQRRGGDGVGVHPDRDLPQCAQPGARRRLAGGNLVGLHLGASPGTSSWPWAKCRPRPCASSSNR